MNRKRWILLSTFLLLITAAVLFRFVVLEKLVASKLERWHQKTGVRVTYERLDVSFNQLVLEQVSAVLDTESAAFAKSDAVTVDLFSGIVQVTEVRLHRNKLIAAGRGSLHLFQNSLDAALSMPPVSCDDFLNAFPLNVREKFGGVKLEGKIALDMQFRLDEQNPKRNLLDGVLANGCAVKDFGSLPKPDSFRKSFRHRVYDKDKKPFEMVTGPGSENWVGYDDISRYVIAAVIEAEDPLFLKHDGVLLARIKTAARVDMSRGVFRYGASTITMQTAKNLFLTREKTIQRKLREIFFVWYLESNFTKDEILTLYLNLAELGPSIYGIKAAAAYYFGCAPKDLNLRQAAFLAKLLPQPVARSIAREKGEVSKDNARRIRSLLSDMLKAKRITQEEYDEALSEKISFKTASDLAEEAVNVDTEADTEIHTDVVDAGVASGASAALTPAPIVKIPPAQVRRAARPRLQEEPPPLSEILSDRRTHGSDLKALRAIDGFQ